MKLGSIKLADLNGDGIIDKNDGFESDYLPLETEGEETIYIADNVPMFGEPFFGLKELANFADSQNTLFCSFIKDNYTIDYRLTLPDVTYPKLENLDYEEGSLWNAAYKYIYNFHKVVKKLETPHYPAYVIREWNKIAGKNWSEYAYVYSTLTSYFGGVVLVTADNFDNGDMARSRNTKDEMLQYLENLVSKVPSTSAYAIKTINAHLSLNDKDYAKAYNLSKEIISSGKYHLSSDNKPFGSATNAEIILGGYTISGNKNITKGKYVHPLRYREVLLIAAEASAELNKTQEAIQYINEIYRCKNEASYSGSVNQNAVRIAVRNLWKEEMTKEGFDYMLLNRWNILVETLGKHGAMDYNKLLPIPKAELSVNPKMTQNPGYNDK